MESRVIQGEELAELQREAATRPGAPAFAELFPQTRKLLSTLWPSSDESKRFALSVRLSEPEYMEYSLGQLEALKFGFVATDRGVSTFLTDSGLAYCRKYEAELATEAKFNAVS
jgi:hypothetical protein